MLCALKNDNSLVKQSNISVFGDNSNDPVTDMLKNAFREIGLEVYEEVMTVFINQLLIILQN